MANTKVEETRKQAEEIDKQWLEKKLTPLKCQAIKGKSTIERQLLEDAIFSAVEKDRQDLMERTHKLLDKHKKASVPEETSRGFLQSLDDNLTKLTDTADQMVRKFEELRPSQKVAAAKEKTQFTHAEATELLEETYGTWTRKIWIKKIQELPAQAKTAKTVATITDIYIYLAVANSSIANQGKSTAFEQLAAKPDPIDQADLIEILKKAEKQIELLAMAATVTPSEEKDKESPDMTVEKAQTLCQQAFDEWYKNEYRPLRTETPRKYPKAKFDIMFEKIFKPNYEDAKKNLDQVPALLAILKDAGMEKHLQGTVDSIRKFYKNKTVKMKKELEKLAA